MSKPSEPREPKENPHPGKMHIYNSRGYCWCGAHRDDGLADAITEVLSKRTSSKAQEQS